MLTEVHFEEGHDLAEEVPDELRAVLDGGTPATQRGGGRSEWGREHVLRTAHITVRRYGGLPFRMNLKNRDL